MAFSLYVALGDSMSTDHYPTCDVRNLDAPPGRPLSRVDRRPGFGQ
jgi:hypothetical protein